MTRKPCVLIICDGWGFREETAGNAIASAATPKLDALFAQWPHTLVAASGEAVGLPEGQQGNSEVGHLTIGAGRIIRQPLSRQQYEIASGMFYENEVLIQAIELAKQRGTALHILGLVSPGGVHSHPKARWHWSALQKSWILPRCISMLLLMGAMCRLPVRSNISRHSSRSWPL